MTQTTLSIQPQDTWALLIGMGEFPKDSRLPAIPAVRNNLTTLRALLTDPEIIGIPVDHIFEIENKEGLYKQLIETMKLLPELFDTLIVYYVGHGFRHKEDVYLAATDSRYDDPLTGMAFEQLWDKTNPSATHNLLYVLDCCFSGKASKVIEQRGQKNIAVLTASSSTEIAKAPTDKSHTAFTGCLIRLLEQGCGKELALTPHTLFEELQIQLPKHGHPMPFYAGQMGEIRFAKNRAYHPPVPSNVSPLLPKEGPGVVFTIPLAQNLRFVGRQDLLTQLHTTLATQRLVALCGLGGVGKTQLAVEYAYRYQQEYPAVLWLSLSLAAEVHSRFATLAEGLGIPILQQKQEDLVAQVKHWLASHHDWLLLVDNADELDNLKSFMSLLPATVTGRVLFTTRQQQPPLPIRHLAIETLTVAAGAGFIVQQVYEVTEAEVVQHGEYLAAQALSQQLGGLPLALTQAAAYMRAHSCGCAKYLDLYRKYQQDLLAERGDVLVEGDHLDSVAITFEVSLKPLRTQQPRAIELLYCCAVLHHDGIPEEVLMTTLVINELQLEKLLKPLLGYSLLTRHAESEVSIHKLVQAVLRFELGAALPQWIARLIAVVEKLFPETEGSMKQWAQVEHWQQCERLLASALACAEEIKPSHLETDTAARLLQRLADYLGKKADYDQSLQWYELALAIYERVGEKKLEVVSIRNNMVELYDYKGDYDIALSLIKDTLEMSERVLGDKHLKTAESLSTLGWVYYHKGDYDHALHLCQRALDIREQLLDKYHYDMANSFNHLAAVYLAKGDYEKALPLLESLVEVSEQVLGKEHPDTANSLDNLAILYYAQGKYEDALSLSQRALEILEQLFGKEHPNTTESLNILAGTYEAKGKYKEALPLYERALKVRERVWGEDHPDTANNLHNLAVLYQAQGEYDKALPLYKRALAIRELVLGKEHPDTAASLNNLAGLYQAQGEYDKALPLFERALAIRERVLGTEHPDTVKNLSDLASIYHDRGEYEKALSLYRQALEIQELVLGKEHLGTAVSLNSLALLYQEKGEYEKALPLYGQALAIVNKRQGEQHPDTRIVVRNYQSLLDDINKMQSVKKSSSWGEKIKGWGKKWLKIVQRIDENNG